MGLGTLKCALRILNDRTEVVKMWVLAQCERDIYGSIV